MIFFRVIKKTSEISSKTRNKIISFLQSQDSFALVKFNFTKGKLGGRCFQFGFFCLVLALAFVQFIKVTSKLHAVTPGKTAQEQQCLLKNTARLCFHSCRSLTWRWCFPCCILFWGCRRGKDISPQQVTIPDPGSMKPRTTRKGAKRRCFQIKTLSHLPKNLLSIICNVCFFPPVAPFSAWIHAEQASPSQLQGLPNANWLLKMFSSKYKCCAALLARASKLLIRLLQAKLHRSGKLMPPLEW